MIVQWTRNLREKKIASLKGTIIGEYIDLVVLIWPTHTTYPYCDVFILIYSSRGGFNTAWTIRNPAGHLQHLFT